MIKILTPPELALMQTAGAILAAVKAELKALVRPGTTTLALDAYAEKAILSRGGQPAFKGYQGFKHALCTSVNAAMIHGVPSDKALVAGDLLKIDLGVVYQGYYADSAFSISVGKMTPENARLIAAAEAAFAAGVSAFRPGARLGDIEAAIGASIVKSGFVVAEGYAGHGINVKLHAAPLVRNEGVAKTGPVLKNGMALAIEPMLTQKLATTHVARDKWTVLADDAQKTAHFEETVALIDGAAVILTGGDHG